jgi:hypothetical protein
MACIGDGCQHHRQGGMCALAGCRFVEWLDACPLDADARLVLASGVESEVGC